MVLEELVFNMFFSRLYNNTARVLPVDAAVFQRKGPDVQKALLSLLSSCSAPAA